MSNEYYNRTAQFAPRTKARSDNVRDELDAVSLAFDKLPTPEDIALGKTNFSTSVGTSTYYQLQIPVTFTNYTLGQSITFLAHAANAGASSINVNAKGVVPLVRQDGTPLRAGDIPLNGIMYAVYNGSQFRLATSTALMVLNAEAAQNAAQASQQASAISASNALASQNAAATSAANALASAQNASTSEGIASTAATTATGARDVTLTARDTTLGYRDTASTAATNALASQNAASLSASNASTSEINAGLSATTASNAETTSVNSAAAALASENKANKWAEELEDVPVEVGKFSAKHWATKAETAAGTVIDGILNDDAVSNLSTWSSQKISEQKALRKVPLFSINSFAANEEVLAMESIIKYFIPNQNTALLSQSVSCWASNGTNLAIGSSRWNGKSETAVLSTTDGLTYFRRELGTNGSWIVDYDGTGFILLRLGSNEVLRTTDGVTYTPTTVLPVTFCDSIASNNGRTLCMGGALTAYLTTDNGTTWQAVTLPASYSINSSSAVGLVSINGYFVYANGTENAYYYSTTGETGSWTQVVVTGVSDVFLFGIYEKDPSTQTCYATGNNGSVIINPDMTYTTINQRINGNVSGLYSVTTVSGQANIWYEDWYLGRNLPAMGRNTNIVTHLKHSCVLGNHLIATGQFGISQKGILRINTTTDLNVIIGEV